MPLLPQKNEKTTTNQDVVTEHDESAVLDPIEHIFSDTAEVPSQEVPNTQESYEVTPQKTLIPEQKPEVIEQTYLPRESHRSTEMAEPAQRTLKRKLSISTTLPSQKRQDALTMQIEKIMEEDLAGVFKELTPVQQQEFKLKGEETAGKIRQLLSKTQVKIKKIFQLLVEWLRFLPGVSRFFLEQEAKIKSDKIIHLKHRFDNEINLK